MLAGCGLFLGAAAGAGKGARAQGAGGPVRVLMLGDSITAGYGLARGEGPPARIEALLRAKGRNVRVIDAGPSVPTRASFTFANCFCIRPLDFSCILSLH